MKTKLSLSSSERRLLETMQKLNFGRIEGLAIRAGEPVVNPPPRIVKDVKLGSADNRARPELQSEDFVLKLEHVELFDSLRRFENGTIECIEVKAGLPFRITTVEERM
jgi:hypothetical protein